MIKENSQDNKSKKERWQQTFLKSNFNELKSFYDQIRIVVLGYAMPFTQSSVEMVINKYIEYYNQNRIQKSNKQFNQQVSQELNSEKPNIEEVIRNATSEFLVSGNTLDEQNYNQLQKVLNKRQIILQQELKTLNDQKTIVDKMLKNDKMNSTPGWSHNEPMDWKLYEDELNHFLNKHKEKVVTVNKTTYVEYHLNRLYSLDDIIDFVDYVISKEEKPFKLGYADTFIREFAEGIDDNKFEYSYKHTDLMKIEKQIRSQCILKILKILLDSSQCLL